MRIHRFTKVLFGVAVCVSCAGNSKHLTASDIHESGKHNAISNLGEMQTESYYSLAQVGMVSDYETLLTIHHRKHSGDGTFQLTTSFTAADNGKYHETTYTGKRYTLRVWEENLDATI